MAWRSTRDPYHILVSEIMLQQTQVERVKEKYDLFIKLFPDIAALAKAPLSRVLQAWQGLGYNRRALALWKLAAQVKSQYAGKIPADREALRKLPGIGEATSGALCAFAFNLPCAFIETNIRTVFLHHFFPGKSGITDKELLPLVDACIDSKEPRRWYYALMDYGVHLKSSFENPSRRSRHYNRQTAFAGSNRQLRGLIIKKLLGGPLEEKQLKVAFPFASKKAEAAIKILLAEGFLKKRGRCLAIA